MTQNSLLTSDGTANVRHFLRDDDLNHQEYLEVLELALHFRQDFYYRTPYAGPRSVAVLFDKNSTRTRASFASGIAHLGGYPLIMDSGTSQISRGESVADTVHVLEQMVDAIVWRTFGQSVVEEAALNAAVPVVNALTDTFHPCQVLADLATLAYLSDNSPRLAGVGHARITNQSERLSAEDIKRKVQSIKGKHLAYLGDGANNMAHSYLLGCVTAGVNVTICCPNEYSPSKSIVADARELATLNGCQVEVTDSLEFTKADVITTDAWLSMGMDKQDADQRAAAFVRYQVNDALMAQHPDAVFMHCLPAYRNNEVTPSVIDGKKSAVFVEAGFRLHAQKALLTWLDEHSEIPRLSKP
ncbi:MAG: ornithine carbamoyltransferase [Candidatus Ancillula sp.]|nr:ornithine carbamoyltransferase [Candidatus Ancillula sp.]